MTEREIEIRERIRNDRTKYRDSLLTLQESHIVMNALQRLEAIESENAELLARLDNAVEVKAKIDDTIYLPWIYDGVSSVAELQVFAIHFLMDGSVIYATDLDKGLGEQEIDFLSKYHYGNFSYDDFGVMVFTDKLKAEERLAELKGEKK